ncbi:hypothetical protein [Streptacidiphilus cavernicola]|uniref:SWIM-type domain-containing protein n=1 Tax=Streptacidiphilus cavernicola TaxID=3342716 RepID=A0ABV6VY42_9ACTN
MTTRPDGIPLLAANLKDSPRNRDSATKAWAKLAELEYAARGGYPGSDVHWPISCPCGFTGNQFYSHMRRDRRHAGCTHTVKAAS